MFALLGNVATGCGAPSEDSEEDDDVAQAGASVQGGGRSDRKAPTVSISSPASGTAYTSAQSVTIAAAASDNVGVTRVEFYDGSTLAGTDTTAPYSFAWSVTSAKNGNHSWKAKAYDAAGNSTTSSAISLTVNIVGTDSTPPTVSITSPSSGTTYTAAQTVTIAASASDNVGVAKVEFYDGATLKGTDTSSPFSYSWAFSSANNGGHSWTAKAYDAAGNSATSAAKLLTVNIASATQPGEHIWSKRFGSTGNDYGKAVKIDSNGNVVTAGYFGGSAVDFGGGLLTNTGSSSLYMAQYNAQGTHLWSKALGGAAGSSVQLQSIAIDGNDDIVATGFFTSSVNFGGGTLTSAGIADIFIAKYSGVDGTHLWSKRIGSTDHDTGAAIAVDGSENILVTGTFRGTADFGGVTLTGYYMSLETFVAKYTSSGALVWAKRFTNNSADEGRAIATDAGGNVFVTGDFNSKIDFGGGLFTTADSQDIFVVKLSPAGAHLWSKQFGGPGQDFGFGITVDGSGNAVITGQFGYLADFGNGSVSAQKDIFLGKYAGANGAHLWSRTIGGVGEDSGRQVTVNDNGNIALTGTFSYAVNFGGGSVTSQSNSLDMFVAEYAGADGAYLWVNDFKCTGYDWGFSVAYDSDSTLVATGFFSDSVNAGGGALPSAGAVDSVLAKLTSY